MTIELGQSVHYHPLPDHPHDGKVYRVVGLFRLCGVEMAMLEGKRAAVPVGMLSVANGPERATS